MCPVSYSDSIRAECARYTWAKADPKNFSESFIERRIPVATVKKILAGLEARRRKGPDRDLYTGAFNRIARGLSGKDAEPAPDVKPTMQSICDSYYGPGGVK